MMKMPKNPVSLGRATRWSTRYTNHGAEEIEIVGELITDWSNGGGGLCWFRPKDDPRHLYPLFDDSDTPTNTIKESWPYPTKAESEEYLRRIRGRDVGPPDTIRPLNEPVDF